MVINARLTKAIVISLAVAACAANAETPNLPAWLTGMINSYAQAKNAPKISEYEFNNKHVYVVDSTTICCDQGAVMLDQDGKKVCNLIGFTGAWEKSCANFPKEGKLVRVIYENKQLVPSN